METRADELTEEVKEQKEIDTKERITAKETITKDRQKIDDNEAFRMER